MHERLRRRFLIWWAGFVCRRPVWVLMVAWAVAAGCLGVTSVWFEFEPDRNALISGELEWNQRFEAWRVSSRHGAIT